MTYRIKYFSTFAGIGGFEVAIHSVFPNAFCVGYSEIDKYAIQIYQKHFPNHKNFGDITQIDIDNLPDFDLLVGGSPCQDLSIAKKNREGLEGSRSGLFYKFVEILKKKKPSYFILENVASMLGESQSKINRILGEISRYSNILFPDYVKPIMINAALVSAQNRKRLFWANFPITQPDDKGILLKDILEDGNTEKFKSYCIDANYYKETNLKTYQEKGKRQLIRIGQINEGGQANRVYSTKGKSVGLSALGGGQGAKTGLYLIDYYNDKIKDGSKAKTLGTNPQCETSIAGQSIMIIPEATKKGYAIAREGDSVDLSFPYSKTRRGRVGTKAKNIMTSQNIGVFTNSIIRKLTPIECERLQTFPDNWTEGISNTQRYKTLGNAVCVEVIKHILQCLKERNDLQFSF